MPLSTKLQDIKKNIIELNTGVVSDSRKKAINTYAKKHRISKEEARFQLSLAIAKSIAKK
jgi:hypothetical protein